MIKNLKTNLEKLKPNVNQYSLELNISKFIRWYKKNIFSNAKEYDFFVKPKLMKKHIDEIACKYKSELKYSYSDLFNLFNNTTPKSNVIYLFNKKRNYSFFINNFYEDKDYDSFAKLQHITYKNELILNKNKNKNTFRLQLNNNGDVQKIILEESSFDNSLINSFNIENIHLSNLYNMCKTNNILSKYQLKIIKNELKRVSLFEKFKEKFLNAIMYYLIKKEGAIYGPRIAFLWAFELDLDISIPIIYAINDNDYTVNEFINIAVKSGVPDDLEVIKNYFDKKFIYKYKLIKLNNIIPIINYDDSLNFDEQTQGQKEKTYKIKNVIYLNSK